MTSTALRRGPLRDSTPDAVDSDALSPTRLRQAFGSFPSGVVAACAEVDGVRVGMAISSFVSVSLDPPLAAVFVQSTSTTWPVLRRAASLGISVLGVEHESHVAALSARTGDRFASLRTSTQGNGAVLVEDAAAWIEVEVDSEAPAGDHLVVMLRIVALSTRPDVEPLVYHRSRLRSLRAAPEVDARQR
jgi:flavin reductase (DIM6/NTAB) family NADH-FMN oxidoreductase RutF